MTFEDSTLATRASRGDVEAFTQLVRKHSNLVYRIALRILGPEDAKDASQEVWVRVWRSMGSFRLESAFSTWLYRITVNTCLSARRREMGQEAHQAPALSESIPYLQEPPGGEGDPEAAALGRERMDEAIRGLRQIRSDHRAALVLRHMEGLSYPEIAEILEVPEGTAKGWVSRGRAGLLVVLSRGEEAGSERHPTASTERGEP
ncbi:MAG: RNA polymerase sigma factor [Rubrobacter sp.]|jgi:RNA polymerase sigma-70 factor (ECF subfamily)|nr:RNA polymerase sigma factor [Rubrobacter sp.]